MSDILEYQPGVSTIHGLHPLTKLGWALVILVLSLLFTDWIFVAAILASVWLVAFWAGVFPVLARSFKGLLIFAFILFAIQVFFYNEGRLYFYLLPFAHGYLPVTEHGVFLGLAMGLRMLTIVSSYLVFLSVTRTRDLLTALVEKVKLPNDVAFMILSALRFIPSFLNDLKNIADAQKARAFVLEGNNPIRKVKAYLPIAVPLVLMSLKKAERLALAMEARGYGHGTPTHLYEARAGLPDVAAVVILVFMVVMGLLLRLQGFGLSV